MEHLQRQKNDIQIEIEQYEQHLLQVDQEREQEYQEVMLFVFFAALVVIVNNSDYESIARGDVE